MPNHIHVLWEQLKMNGKETVYTRMVEGGGINHQTGFYSSSTEF
jgi:hypothetical protein